MSVLRLLEESKDGVFELFVSIEEFFADEGELHITITENGVCSSLCLEPHEIVKLKNFLNENFP